VHNCWVVSVCVLSGDSGWQARDVDVEEKWCQEGSLWETDIQALDPAPFSVAKVKLRFSTSSMMMRRGV